jgi:hypothetical protein
MDFAYWTRNCHGFRVETPDGRLGIVEDVLYGADPNRPAALAVRGGLFGTRVEIVPTEELGRIDPRRTLVTLLSRHEEPRRTAA